MTPAVQHDPESSLFFIEVDGHRALQNYQVSSGVLTVLHTEVPPAIGGRGIAAQLTRATLDFARSKHWKVRSRCSYTTGFLQQHAEYADLIGA